MVSFFSYNWATANNFKKKINKKTTIFAMKNIITPLLTLLSATKAIELDSLSEVHPSPNPQLTSTNAPYSNYFSHQAYQEPDYDKEYVRDGEKLPGADFNRQVFNFDERKKIWHEQDYEERVKVEAEMLVALEALKESVVYLVYDIHQVQSRIDA